MSTVNFDSSGLNDLRAVFAAANAELVPRTRQVLAKGALNIKNDARKKVEGLAHAPHYPRSITYSTGVTAGVAWAEIGPDKDKRQGALGNILEYGTSKNPPYAHLGPALDAEAPNFERYMAELGEDLLS